MKRPLLFLAVLASLLAAAMLLSLWVGPTSIPTGRVFGILLSWDWDNADTDALIVWQLRLPRVLLATFVGAGLAAAGAGYQGLFRNPLADPFVIGASGGAALGAAVAIVAGWEGNLLGLGAVPMAALAGSLLAVAIVYTVATVGRDTPTISLLLAGVAVSSLMGAGVSLLMFLSDKTLMIIGWLMGSFSLKGWDDLKTTAPLIFLGAAALWLLSRPLDSLTFGEESAASLGLRMKRLRAAVVISASLVTAASVAAGGVIGFVGLIAPHIARLLVGARHALVIPASGLLGALLLLVADDLARTVIESGELPVGVITALIGGPFFLYLLKTRSSRQFIER